jgi:hypothetical protein
MWKFLNESVQGTSHRQGGIVCQDSSLVTPDGEDVIIAVVSDGAGSASESQIGSSLSCSMITTCAQDFFAAGGSLAKLDNETIQKWLRDLRDALTKEAEKRNLKIRDLACTLIFAIVGTDRATFGQIGDGAIVTLDSSTYSTVFWPQSGEYQNTTFFVTDDDYENHFQIRIDAKAIDELAMFTDGLQMLALNYAAKTVHEPFFKPMFSALRAASDQRDLIGPLREFLNSSNVNNRTDDDKTLVLVTRLASDSPLTAKALP